MLQECAVLLTERQKLRSKLRIGRLTAGASLRNTRADELVEDSNDEKRIEKAEKAAERKAGLKRKKKQQPSQTGGPSVRSHRFPPYPLWQGARYNSGMFYYPVSLSQHQQSTSAVQSGVVRKTGGAAGMLQRAVVGPCLTCGEMGHLQMYCPRT